jgi:hypothetical protein
VKLPMLLSNKHAYNCYGFLNVCKNHKREEDANIKGYFRQQENKSYGFCAELLVASAHMQQLESIRQTEMFFDLLKLSCGLFMHS